MSAAAAARPEPHNCLHEVMAANASRVIRKLEIDQRELVHENERLARENAQLRAELAATMLPYKGHTLKVINGVTTVFLHAGAVYERVQRSIDRPGEAGFEWHWRKVESIPTSPAERLDAVAPALTEMAVVGEAMGS